LSVPGQGFAKSHNIRGLMMIYKFPISFLNQNVSLLMSDGIEAPRNKLRGISDCF